MKDNIELKKIGSANLIIEALLWAATLLVIIPLYYVIINSLKPASDVAGSMTASLPAALHFENYSNVLKGKNMLGSFLNSFIYAAFSTLLTCILASMASFVIVRRKNRFNKTMFYLLLVGMIAPLNMVTTFWVMKSLNLINTYQGMILLYAALYLPFSIFLYKGFINNLPIELDEAAIVDGASPLRTFFSIVFPLLKPVTITVVVLNFVNCWNDFLFPLYFTTESKMWGVVMMLFQFIGQFVSSKNLLFAASTLVIIPTLIIYIFGQRYIISGMTAGAVKG
jgi:raffinose/stachyose/melibiose transport system permease protein